MTAMCTSFTNLQNRLKMDALPSVSIAMVDLITGIVPHQCTALVRHLFSAVTGKNVLCHNIKILLLQFSGLAWINDCPVCISNQEKKYKLQSSTPLPLKSS
jgi:hypothetical protein